MAPTPAPWLSVILGWKTHSPRCPINTYPEVGYFKTWVTLKPHIDVPIGVPLCCSILTRSWKILMSYFIYSVVKVMEPGWSFVQKLDRERASFSRYWHLKFNPEKPNSWIAICVAKLQAPYCSRHKGRTFPHSYTLLSSIVFAKTHFMWN